MEDKKEQRTLSVVLKIRSYLRALTKTEAVVAEYVLRHVNEVIYMSVTEVAEQAGVGDTTVLRFCRKLGFKGFQDFKLLLAQDLALNVQQAEEIGAEDDEDTLVRRVLSSHRLILEETGKMIERSSLRQAVEVLTKAERILFTGVGSSGVIALQAAHAFSRIGKKCDAKQDPHFQAVSTSLLTKDDAVVALSVSGSTKDTIDNLEIARVTGASIICITHNARSPITQLSDISLLMAARENPLQGSSFSSQVSQLAVLEMLYRGVSLNLKETADRCREKTAQAVSEKLY